MTLQSRLFNIPQDQLTSDDYYTPPWIFERMALRFDLDVCAPPTSVPWIPADRFFTQEDDGLAQTWEGRVWMNPPFSGAGKWVERFTAHHWGVCLVQVSKGHYSELLWDTADGIYLLRDIRFVIGLEGPRSDIYMPCWMAAFGDECVEAISRLGRVR